MHIQTLFVVLVPAAGLFAQNPTTPQAFTCVANAGTPVIVRVEGITELVGDLLLQCQGGTPTPAGQAVPPANVTVFLNTGVTNRILAGGNFTDAFLVMDDPTPANRVVAPFDATTGSSFTGTLTGQVPASILQEGRCRMHS